MCDGLRLARTRSPIRYLGLLLRGKVRVISTSTGSKNECCSGDARR